MPRMEENEAASARVQSAPVDAVRVRGLHKSYRPTIALSAAARRPVLVGVDLTVPTGRIYGLLGPSGCGKTSLLRCILGRLKVDRGTILVFGHEPGTKDSGIPGPQIGYMPQEMALYLLLTIDEILRYYGAINGLSTTDVRERTRHLMTMLRLPSGNRVLHNLSGGQVRRVAFAAALLHRPRLLILDEPTVGVDPVTKQAMWNHLLGLAERHGVSVILTTHYIEEARQADMVGMIHCGKMVAEDSTAALLHKYNESTLEDVFLKLCCRHYAETKSKMADDAEPQTGADVVIVSKRTDVENNCVDDSVEGSYRDDDRKCNRSATGVRRFLRDVRKDWCVDRTRLVAVLLRIILNMYRFPGGVLLVLLLPMTQVVMFTQMVGTPIRNIGIGVVNEDTGEFGAKFLAQLDPGIVVQKSAANISEGEWQTKEGSTYGYIHIKPNFSSVVHDRYTDWSLAKKKDIDTSTISVYLDNTNFLIMAHAEFHLTESYQQFIVHLLDDANLNPALVQYPLNVSRNALHTIMKPGSVYMMSGEMVVASYFAAVPITVLGIFMERYHGHMEINRVMGVTSAEMIFALILVQLVVLIVQNLGIMLAALSALHSCKGSLYLIYAMTYVVGLNGTVMGICASLLTDQIISVVGVVSGYLFLSPSFAGMFWPLESYPLGVQYVFWALPLAWPVRAIDLIIHRGWGFWHLEVLYGFGMSFLWLGIHILLSLVLLYARD